jgi:hypothetical protein
VRLLDGRVLTQQVLPAVGKTQQVEVQQLQCAAGVFGPRLVKIVGQQRSLVYVERGLRRCFSTLGHRGLTQAAELLGVDHDVRVHQQRDHFLTQHQRPCFVTKGTAGVMGSLVQSWSCRLDGEPGPQRLDHALTMQSAAR